MLLKVKRVVPRAYEIYYKGQNIISLVRPKRNALTEENEYLRKVLKQHDIELDLKDKQQ